MNPNQRHIDRTFMQYVSDTYELACSTGGDPESYPLDVELRVDEQHIMDHLETNGARGDTVIRNALFEAATIIEAHQKSCHVTELWREDAHEPDLTMSQYGPNTVITIDESGTRSWRRNKHGIMQPNKKQ